MLELIISKQPFARSPDNFGDSKFKGHTLNKGAIFIHQRDPFHKGDALMANLEITLTDNTNRSSIPDRVVVRPRNAANRPVADADVNRVDTEAEAGFALNTVEEYLNQATHNVDLTRLGIRVGNRRITLPEIGRAYPTLEDRINRIQAHRNVMPAAPATTPTTPVAPPAPAATAVPPPPAATIVSAPPAPVTTPVAPPAPAPTPTVLRSPWALFTSADVNALRQSGDRGPASYIGTRVELGGAYNFLNGNRGSLGAGLFLRYGHIGGDGSSLGSIHGGAVGAAALARVNIGHVASLLVRGDVALHYLTGRNQLPGRADTAAISGFGLDASASLAFLFNVGRGFSIGPNANYFHSFTPGGQNALGTSYDNTFYGFGGGLTAYWSPVSTPATDGAEICDGETPAHILRDITRLSTELAGNGQSEGLRDENARLRDIVAANVSAMRLTPEQLLGFARQGYQRYLESRSSQPVTNAQQREQQASAIFPDGTNLTNPDAIPAVNIPNPLPEAHCSEELSGLRDSLQLERNRLDRQNGELEGILIGLLIHRGIPASAAPAVMQTITLLEFPTINFQQGAPHASQPRAQEFSSAMSFLAGFNSPAVPNGATGNPVAATAMDNAQRVAHAEAVRARASQIANNAHIRSTLGNYNIDARFIANIANVMLGYELPQTVGGDNQEAVREVLIHLPVLFEAHASAEGAADAADATAHHLRHADVNNNLALTQRRAQLTVAYLIALGVPADRLRGEGYGESRLLISETGLRGTQRLYAQARNRRTRVVADISRMDHDTGRVLAQPATTTPAANPSDAGVAPADAAVPSDAAVRD